MRRGNGYEVICYVACTGEEGDDDAIAGNNVSGQVIRKFDNLKTEPYPYLEYNTNLM